MGVIILCHDISTPTLKFHGSDYIMPRYIHPHSLVPREWLYHATIYPPPLSSSTGVIISCHDISTPILKFHGSDYIVSRYIHPHSLVPREWLYHATIYIHPHSLVPREWLYHARIYPPPLSSSMGVIISCQDISPPPPPPPPPPHTHTHTHTHTQVPWEWLYRATIYPPHSQVPWEQYVLCNSMSTPLFGCVTRSWSWHIFTPDNNWGGGDYIVKMYSYSQHYLGSG